MGVFLLARLWVVLSVTEDWFLLVCGAGAASLIFTSTFVGPRLGLAGMAAYAAAKAGLVGVMHVLAAE